MNESTPELPAFEIHWRYWPVWFGTPLWQHFVWAC